MLVVGPDMGELKLGDATVKRILHEGLGSSV